MEKLSFSARYFLVVLIAIISGLVFYFLFEQLSIPYGSGIYFVVMATVLAVLLKRMQKKVNDQA